jgi:hypothetical protein
VAVLVDSNDPRGPQAVALVVEDRWKRHFDTVTRRVCFDVPSSRPGRNYRTTADGCKHMLAVRMQLELDEQEYAF